MDVADVSLPPSASGAGVLRIVTCGTVDDGKSTLVGRLLYNLNCVPTDQLAAAEQDSRRGGKAGPGLDYALLLDGLEAEREQGITIDVAYRYLSTPRRAFVIADSPGHEQYTRNMATAASVSDLALVLVDARNGITTQTRRHSLIAGHFGIRHAILAVNKCDLVGYAQDVFQRISDDYRKLSYSVGIANVLAIPISALHGDNVTDKSSHTPWYDGRTLLESLETVNVEADRISKSFRMSVQWVCRPNAEFRGFAGTVASGCLRRGDTIVVAGSGAQSNVARIMVGRNEHSEVQAGSAVMLVLAHEIDVSRGDVLSHPDARPDVIDQFAAHVLWLAQAPMIPGRPYLMKIGTRTVPASVTALKHRLDIDSGAQIAGKTLGLNEIGMCNVATAVPLAVDRFADNRETGAFILIDRSTNATAGAGMVAFPLRRASNLHPQRLDVDKHARTAIKGHRPAVLWLTGLSGAGKSTIANAVELRLSSLNAHTYLIDGDNVRRGLNRDLGFTDADRVENIRRVAEVARLFVEAGLIVIVSLISPFLLERKMARECVGAGEFVEIFVDTPIELCRQRDPKGLYAKAARKELVNFTGVDSPYEAPDAPDLHLTTVDHEVAALADHLIAYLRDKGILNN
jgi:bifunctional enzyme CysN/CysC